MEHSNQFDTDKAWNKLHKRILETGKVSSLNINANRVIGLVASVVILIGVVSILMFNISDKVTFDNNSLTIKMVTLPDGSKVAMNTMSKINYGSVFGSETRTVTLVGEAFFEVVKDETKPFIVNLGRTNITVLGTSFNVDAKTDEIIVVVKSGRVEVGNEKFQQVVLLAGDQALIMDNTDITKQKNINCNYISWLNKKLVFKATPLAIACTDIEKTYNCNIELNNSSISNYKITSTFDNVPLNDVLESIALTFNIKIENIDGKYVLTSK